MPSVLCEYLYNLSEIFSGKFYSNCQVSIIHDYLPHALSWWALVEDDRRSLIQFCYIVNLLGKWVARGNEQTLALWGNSHSHEEMLLSSRDWSSVQDVICSSIRQYNFTATFNIWILNSWFLFCTVKLYLWMTFLMKYI